MWTVLSFLIKLIADIFLKAQNTKGETIETRNIEGAANSPSGNWLAERYGMHDRDQTENSASNARSDSDT